MGQLPAFLFAHGLHRLITRYGGFYVKEAFLVDGIFPPRHPKGGAQNAQDIADRLFRKAPFAVPTPVFLEIRDEAREYFCRQGVDADIPQPGDDVFIDQHPVPLIGGLLYLSCPKGEPSLHYQLDR